MCCPGERRCVSTISVAEWGVCRVDGGIVVAVRCGMSRGDQLQSLTMVDTVEFGGPGEEVCPSTKCL